MAKIKLVSEFKHDDFNNNCSIEVQYLSGAFKNSSEKEGLSHLAEHLVLTPEDIKSLKTSGVYYNASTSIQLLKVIFEGPFSSKHEYGISCLSEYLKKVLDGITRDISEDELLKEKKVVLNEISKSKNDINRYALNQTYNTILEENNPWRSKNDTSLTVIGSAETVGNIQLEDLREFYEQNIKQEAPVIKLYYEGKDGDYKLVLEMFESIISDYEYGIATTEYPFELLDNLNSDHPNEIRIALGSESVVKNLMYFVCEYPDEISPMSNLVRYMWHTTFRNALLYIIRRKGVGYVSSTYSEQLNFKQLNFVEFNLNKSEDADSLIKETSTEILEYFKDNIESLVDDGMKRYLIECDIYPVTPLSNLNNRVQQIRRYGKEVASVEELRNRSLSLTKEEVLTFFNQMLSQAPGILRINIGAN